MSKACRFQLTLIGRHAATLALVLFLSIQMMVMAGCDSEPKNSEIQYVDLSGHYFTTNGVPISIEVGTFRPGGISPELNLVVSSPQQLMGGQDDDEEANGEEDDSATEDEKYKKLVFFVLSTKPLDQPEKGREPEPDFRIRFTETKSNYVKLPIAPTPVPRRFEYQVICPSDNDNGETSLKLIPSSSPLSSLTRMMSRSFNPRRQRTVRSGRFLPKRSLSSDLSGSGIRIDLDDVARTLVFRAVDAEFSCPIHALLFRDTVKRHGGHT